jgi:hypothetical protein
MVVTRSTNRCFYFQLLWFLLQRHAVASALLLLPLSEQAANCVTSAAVAENTPEW